MAKQIKIGFDKTAAREAEFDQVMVDVRGNLLRDDKGEYLYTKSIGVAPEFFRADNAMSISVNNEVARVQSLLIEEQFPQTSEVSVSLLGVPRANQQQSLLSDVSVYGLDDNTWEFYNTPNPGQPREWSQRRNKNYGDRYDPKRKDYADQQAVAMESYPVPYTYPFGPLWGSQNLYNEVLFTNYLRFVELGNLLHDYFDARGYKTFAKNNFLPRGMGQVIGIITLRNLQKADVEYNEDLSLAFSSVENWTMTWMDIRDNQLTNPVNGLQLSPSAINNILSSSGALYNFSDTRPGYSSTSYRYSQLQSKEAFRYQPGAISGFTFGVKLNTDPSSTSTVVEWGCANSTDQLMFQVKGSNFSILRRSTVPLTAVALELNNLKEEDQNIVSVPNPFERAGSAFNVDSGTYTPPIFPMHETIMTSDSFNGDPLNGTGRSGYNISFNEVTMYKIEYSWYGAIGAKFYAYVPIGNEECRWVLIHTILIENSLDQPSLKNPFMHFRYVTYITDTSTLREPIYLFKYGASYYIDGADEGTYSFNNYKTRTKKTITASNSRPVIGFVPKDFIFNSDGIGTASQKNFYIDDISVSTDIDARIDILECEGCRNGYGHFYATSLVNGQRAPLVSYTINESGKIFHTDTNIFFNESDNNKKILGEGIFSSYTSVADGSSDVQFIDIKRRLSTTRDNNSQVDTTYSADDLVSVNGVPTSPLNYTFDGRLTGYDDVTASSYPITKPDMRVHILNTITRDDLGHYNEFIVGLTTKKPEMGELVQDSGITQLLFDGDILNYEDEIYGEFSQFSVSKNIDGVDVGEGDRRYGSMFESDPRIPVPKGQNSGRCSTISFKIRDLIIADVEYRTEVIVDGATQTGDFMVFQTDPSLLVLGGEIGVFDGNQFISSGILFTSNIVGFVEGFATKYYAEIDSPIDLSSSVINGSETIAFKTIRSYGRYWDVTKVYTFNAQELYLFVSMRDNARINNIVIEEFDSMTTTSHTPNWMIDPISNISVDNVFIEEDFNPATGKFDMGGLTFEGNSPANFIENNRLDSVKFDDNIELPLRPANYKSSFYISANKNQKIDMDYLFGIDKFKATPGSFNNKVIYLSAKAINTGEVGQIDMTVNGKEQ